jgi:hypothetical protein
VEDRGRFGLRRVNVEALDRSRLLEREGDLALFERRNPVVVDDDDVPQVRQLAEDLADLGGWVMTADVSAFESRTRRDSSPKAEKRGWAMAPVLRMPRKPR